MNLFIQLAKPFGNRGLSRYPGVRGIYRLLSRHLIPEGISTVRYDGFIMDIDRRAYPEMLIGDGSKYLPVETKIFKSMVKPGMTILDLGAAMGYYTLAAARLAGPTGRVYAFEPSPKSFKLLEINVERSGLKNIILVNKAVSNIAGITKLYISKSNPLENSLGRGRASSIFVEVPTITLDGFLGTAKVDIIKMNIEGAEPLVLRGMEGIIEENRNLVMIVEIDPKALRGLGLSQEDYINALQRNFNLQVISMRLGTISPFRGISQIRQELFPRNGTARLICIRRRNA